MDLARVLQALKNADAAGDTAAAQQLAQLAQQMSQPAKAPVPEFKRDYTTGEMLSKAVTRGAKQLGSAFGDVLPAMGASALGFDEYAQRQMGEAADTQAEIERNYAPQYRGTQDVTGLGSALGFGLETIAEQVPNIATALVPGLGAGAIAARAGAGLAGRAAAVNAGTFLGSYSQTAPEVFQNIYETTGKMEPGVSALFGAGSAALDSILPAQLAKSITGPLKVGIIEKVLEKSGMDKGLLRSVTAGMAKGVGGEGLTEGAQEGINIAAERFVAENPQVFGSKEWDRIMQSAVKGAIAGGAFGGVGGGVEAGRAGAQRREEYAQALEKRGDRQAAAEVRRQSAEIEATQAQDPQQSLPGFEMGPATGLMPTAEPTEVQSKSPKSTQAEMFTAEGELAPGMTKLADKDAKAAANQERQAQQREAAQIKEDQKALKDALAGLTATPKNLVDLAKAPPPIQQTIMQAQGEMNDLAAKRGPKVQSAPPIQAQPTTTPTVTPPAPVVEPVAESTVIGADKDGLKAFGKTFGIGPTARILRADGPLAGKDISDPAQAAEVRTVLEAYASGKPAVGAAEKIEAYLKRPEFQGAQNVAGPVTEPVGASPELAGEPGPVAAPGPAEAPERGGMVPAGQPAEYPAGGEGQQPRALTERQQRIQFGKSLGAAQSYPGSLQGRMNLPAQKAAVKGDFPGVVNALEKSKNATVAEVARRAKELGTKIQIDDTAGETYEGRSAFQDQMSIDGAKMHLDALNKLRELSAVVDQLPDGAALPYAITRTPIETYNNGEKHYTQLTLGNIVENNNSMFTGLDLPEGRALRTKEDFKALADAYERTTQELGEDKLRLTSTASAVQQGVAGVYNADTDTISVPEYYAKNEAVLAHEIVHAQVLNAVASPTKEQRPAVERLGKLYDHVKKIVDERAKADEYFRAPYGATSQQEFIAEGLSNPDFQYLLSRIPYENTTVWDKFVETIAKLLGLKNDNALTELLTVYSDLTKGAPSGTQAPQTQQAKAQRQEPAPAKPVGKRAATDVKKAEKGRVEAEREQNEFIAGNDQRVDDLLTGRLRALGKEAGLRAKDLPSEKYRDTEAHKMLRLPGLFNEFFRLQGVVAKAQEPNQKAKNAQSLKQITDAIAAADPNANQMLGALRQMSTQQRDTLISQMNKQGFEAFEAEAKARVAAIKQEKAESRTEADTSQEIGDEELEALANTFNERFFQETGKRIFLPKFVGPEFDNTDRELAAQGNGNALLRNMIDQTSSPAIKHVLRKLRSLNLTTKIVVGPVEGNRSGSYDPATDTITLSPEFGLNAHTFIHEYTHAAISKVLANPNHPLTKQFVTFFNQMQDRLGAAYGAQDLQEFAAELVGNPKFQAVLKSIKTPRSESMFKRIMQSIAEFFGFQKSAYDTGLNFINDAIDISGDVEANAADKMFQGMGDFKAVSNIGNAMPRLAGDMIDRTRNVLSNARESGIAQAAFGLLRLDNINTLYKKELPSIQTLLNALEKRNGMQEAMIKDINTKYKDMVKVQQKYPQAMKRVNDIAIDARLKAVDILDPNFKPTPGNINDYQNLKQAFSTLPKEVQDVYRTIRKDYENSLDAYEKVLLDAAGGVSPSLAKRLTLQFQTRKRVVGYVPFLRQGDFWVEYADPATGERTATSFESFRQRQQFTDQMLAPKGIQFKNYQNLQDIRFSGESLPPTHFLAEVMTGLKKQGASQAQIDSVYQSYLTLFPGESIVKQFMKSKNVLGMDRDIVRGYGDVMVRWARKLSNSEYIPQIDNAVSEIAAQAQNANDPTITAAAQNILDQSEFFHNPNYNTFVNTATTASYFMYMAGNISSALINLTSLPMMVWPMIGGKFGFDKASAAMLNAGKVAMNDWSKNPKYKNLYNTLMDHAQLEHTMARELLEGRRQTTDDFVGLKAKILDGLAMPLAATERFNRASTAIAAYDLAKQSGMNEDAAVQYALTTVKDIHTSGLAATGPKWMQTPLGRMFFTFKSFVWNSAFVMARAFHQAYKGESPEVRKAAQRQLLGTVGMATAFAGAKGLPFYGAASTLATMIAALFGDDDEPYDFDAEMREFLGEALYKGAFNYITNLEVANRAGIASDLLFRDDPKGVAEHGYVLSALQQAIGPIGSIAVNVGNAANMFSDGHTERAIESILPGFLRNGLKGARYMVEGATTLKGDPVMEDISAYNSLMQMIGFSPADLSSTYEKVSSAKGYEREVNARRVKLLQLYDMAQHAGDTEMMSTAREKIASFNEAIPAKRITGDTLRRSIAARAAAEKDMINGVRFDKKLRPEIEAKFFDDEE
jgi:hypothetical protein